MLAPLCCACNATPFVFARDGRITYCDMEPPAHLMDSFMVRGDNQIMSLEILSIALGKHVLLLCARVLCVIACCVRIVELCRRNCRSQFGGLV